MTSIPNADTTTTVEQRPPPPTQCSTYTFPEVVRSPENRGHLRSVSHGGATTLLTGSLSAGATTTTTAATSTNTANPTVPRPSALKGSRGHQRAFSHGQITDQMPTVRLGHSRVGSKTDFILPPGHRDVENGAGGGATSVAATTGGGGGAGSGTRGHSRQASRSESIYTLRRTAPPPLWRRWWQVMLGRKARTEFDERYRIVVPNHIVPPKTPKKEHPNGRRPDNRIRTTKYTLLSFLPRNLLEQFHRVANLYFIFIVLLNWFPAINAFGKEIAMIPVMFVLGVTAVKDLFEDRRRHASDKRINNSTCRIYNSEAARYKKILWKELRVGDLIHLSNNEVVPADILLLRSSDSSGLCYIDTGHLDGETNLKQRQVVRGFVEKQNVFEPSKFRSRIEVEAPTTKIYRFHGAIIHPNGSRIPIGTDNLLLRECLLKNTDFIEGIVVYAGPETKAMLNNGGPRYKRSTLERQMNLDVIWCVLILVILCVIGAIGCKMWLRDFDKLGEPFETQHSETIDSILAFWTYVIILQIMIPLSLYVTLEMCKIIQVYHIHNNIDLYDAPVDKRTECRALNITEELGQIQYIFSDKTGTLTENRMIFRHCAIAGVDYNHPKLENETKNGKSMSLSVVPNLRLICDLRQEGAISDQIFTTRQMHALKIQEFLLLLAVCNTVVCSDQPHHDIMNSSGLIESGPNLFDVKRDQYTRLEESRSVTPSPPLNSHFETTISAVSPVESIESTSSNHSRLQKPKLLNFLARKNNNTNLTDEQKLSRTTTPTSCDVKPIFEAESPDELALVDAAYNYNCRLIRRTNTAVTVDRFEDARISFDILAVLPFDSNRKRMSVVIKHKMTGEIVLYCKGADSSIVPRLLPVEDDSEQKIIIDRTLQLVSCYSKDGLRVLLMAKRILIPHEFNEWLKKQQEIDSSPDTNDRRLQDHYSRLENNLELMGATGIEDRLQEGVPETLHSLMSAGIVVWVLTGDKPETAINIAYSAKLFSPQMEILKLMTRSKEAAESTIFCYLADIENHRTQTTSNGSRSAKTQGKALVIDGKTLTFILDRRSNLTKPFLKLTTHCNSVLCCRATPLQKAYIVRVVKEELKMRTLAIGDGANDVSMIQTADVGIGISGQEGMQAVMAADFSLSKFKFLERLLLVHGHWSYDRLSRMVLYFFYKNAAFVFLVFWYQLYCGFSGAVMIDQMYLMLYNLLFTSLPPIAIGVYDQDAPENLLREQPYLYRKGRLGKVYRTYSFWLTIADALYQSLCIFFICKGAYADSDIDIMEFGTTATTACMFVMLLHVAIETQSWTIIHVASIVLSIGAFFLYSFVYNSICVTCFGLPSTYWVIQTAASRMTYWLITLLSTVVALLPRFMCKVIKTLVAPDDVTRALLSQRKIERRGEELLVFWSRSTSSSSICRTADNRPKNNTLTAVG